MDPLFKWLRIVFTDLRPETDLFMYRQMSELLVPQKNCVNRFRMHSTGDLVDFYIGSNDVLSLKFIKNFFFRLYSLKFEDVEESIAEPEYSTVYVTKGVREGAPMVAPSLLQNLAFMMEVSDCDVLTDMAIYNTGKGKAGMSFRIGFSEKTPSTEKIMEKTAGGIKTYSKQSGTKIVKLRNEKHFLRIRGMDPRFLINLVRIPLDEDF